MGSAPKSSRRSGAAPALSRRVIPSFLFSRSAEEAAKRDRLGGGICNFDEFWVYDFDTHRENPVDKGGFVGPAQTLHGPELSVPREQRAAVRKQPSRQRVFRTWLLWQVFFEGFFHGAGGVGPHARYDVAVGIESYGYVRCLPGTRDFYAV